MPAQYPLGQRAPVLLKAFARCLQDFWYSQNRHQLLPPQRQWRRGACQSHCRANARYNRSAQPPGWLPLIRMGRLPRLPLTIFARAGIAGHRAEARYQLVYLRLCDWPSTARYNILKLSRRDRQNVA